jgi:perosamine synthetase
MDPQRRYYFPITGYNFRMTNIAAAILCAQLERREALLDRRRQIFTSYRERLEGIPGVGFQPVADWAEPAQWLFCLTVDETAYGRSRNELSRYLLEEHGVDTRPLFIALHHLPPFREESRRRNENLPVTDRLSATGINLPTYTGLSETDLDCVCDAIRLGVKR